MLPDSLEAAGHELYASGDYREALALYEHGIQTLERRGVKTADDSLIMADLLIRKAYCNYQIKGRSDKDETWLAAWRYVQADEDPEDLVMFAQRVASLHSRRGQLRLEIQMLEHADSIAMTAGLDSLRKSIEPSLDGAVVECFRDDHCTMPEAESDTSETPPAVFIVVALAIGIIVGVWIDPVHAAERHVGPYPTKTGRDAP